MISRKIFQIFAVISVLSLAWAGFGNSDRVHLKDVQVLTLRHGQMTTGRRSSPVPQTKCVGGTAMNKFVPQVVQCYNRGFDGNDYQWECKTDMDNDYRFGQITVVCEGYDYPDDPYILKGSCGLEYTLDYTKQGHASANQGHNYGYDEGYSKGSTYEYDFSKKNNSMVGNIIFLLIVALIVYAVYKTCISRDDGEGGTRAGGTGWGGGGYPGGGGGPPPPGFRDPPPSYDDADCHMTRSSGAGTSNQGGGINGRNGPGFWTGMGAGGLLGYLFGGGRNNAGYYGGYNRGGYNRGWGGGGWGGGGWGSPTFGAPSGGGTRTTGGGGGTRTASGFGGTRRR